MFTMIDICIISVKGAIMQTWNQVQLPEFSLLAGCGEYPATAENLLILPTRKISPFPTKFLFPTPPKVNFLPLNNSFQAIAQ